MSIYILIFMILYGCATYIHKKEKALRQDEVPLIINENFHKRHPNVQTNFHRQTINGIQTYEIHFIKDDKEFSERYDDNGLLIETEQDISFDEIPEGIKSLIRTWMAENNSSNVLKAQKVESQEFKGYEIKTKSKESKTGLLEAFFDYKGQFHHSEEVELTSIPNLN